ncbi:MAG: SDR family NAD(P)-dependent oxidoreductase [Bdellovibrionaceae bacterium]|nr:SDR family NAD(P)-dependent oxidoreductase [Pseudobdellovibrionaceae bacterium]
MKNILITGASSGIGRQLALDYSSAGNKVYAVARSKNKLLELKKEASGELDTIVTDISLRSKVVEEFSKLKDLDIVILNAGTCEYVDIENFNSKLFERVFNVNVFGTVYCIEALLPKIKKGGQLVIVSSMARLLPFTRSEAYGSSKAAVDYIAKSLAVDCEGCGITVHTVSPGFVKTPLTDKNNFSMPFLVSVSEASRIIKKALQQGKRNISFPKRLGWILTLCSLLPANLQRHICVIMRGKI